MRCLHKLEANLNLIPLWYIFSFVAQNIQGGLCSILWRFRWTNVKSVLKSFAQPLTIEDIHLYITDSKSLIRFSFNLISTMICIKLLLSSCIYPSVFSSCYSLITPFLFLFIVALNFSWCCLHISGYFKN